MNLALFDFDGTLTTRETFPAFLHYAAPRLRLVVGRVVLAPLVIGYRLGWLDGVSVRARITSFAFRGMPEARLRALGESFARDVLPGLMRPDMMARLRQHQAQGDAVMVVSGAYDTYLAPWCAAHGVDLACSRLEARDGAMTGRYLGAQCVGEEKVRRIRAEHDLSTYASIHAYGDTPEDEAMLALAQHRWYRGEPRTDLPAPPGGDTLAPP